MLGDSNTARPQSGGGRWTDLVQRRLGRRVIMLNEGLDGRTAGFDAGELNGLEILPRVLFAHAPVDWLLLMLGTNDQKFGYGPPTPCDIVDVLGRLVSLATAAAPSLQVMLLTPPPMGRILNAELRGAHSRLAETAAGIKQLAADRRLPCVDLHAALDAARHLNRDGVHLNKRGRRAVARAVLPMLARKLC